MFRLPVLSISLLLVATSAFAQSISWAPYDALEHRGTVVSSSSDSYVYAAAADSGGIVYAVSRTFCVSTDDGRTWRVTAVGSAADLAAGPHPGEAVITGQNPLYTTDAGAHWLALNAPDADRYCAFGADGWIYTSSQGRISASAGPSGPWIRSTQPFGNIMDMWLAPSGELSVFAYSSSDTAIYRSSDHGVTWRLSCHVPYPYAGLGVSEDGKGNIAVHADGDPDYVSSDLGKTWARVDSLVFYLPDMTIRVSRISGQVASISSNGAIRPFAGYPLCVTPDKTIIGNGLCAAFPYDTTYTYQFREYTAGGVFGRNDTDVFVSAASRNDPYPYVPTFVTPYDRCAVDSDGYFYERTGNAGGRRVTVYTPADMQQWTVLDAPPIFQLRGAPDGSVYASGSNGILYHSTDRGWSWQEIHAGTGRLLFFDISANGEFYVVNDSSTIFRSSDAINWTVAGTAPQSMSRFYATRRGLIALLDSNRIFEVVSSTDDGATWRAEETPLPLLYLDVLADGSLLTVTTDHVYLKYGQSWSAIDGGLPRREDGDPNQTVYSTVGHDMGGHLYVGVVDAGLYRSEYPYSSLSVREHFAAGTHELEAYPNPASNSVSLDVRDNAQAVVVRDALGREVLRASVHSGMTRIDLSMLPAGVYIIETVGGSSPSTARLVVR